MQRLAEPSVEEYVDKKGVRKTRLSRKPLVSGVGWSEDGRTLYVLSDDRKKVSLWSLL